MLGEGQGEEELVFIKVNNVPGTLHLIHSKQESHEVAKKKKKDFPGGPMVRTVCLHCRGTGSILHWGTKIPYALWRSQK